MNQATMLRKLAYYKRQVAHYENLIVSWLDLSQEVRAISKDEIRQAEEICYANWFLPELVLSGTRKRGYTEVKAKIAYHFKKKWYTLQRIASILWNTNHSSVIYILKRYPDAT